MAGPRGGSCLRTCLSEIYLHNEGIKSSIENTPDILKVPLRGRSAPWSTYRDSYQYECSKSGTPLYAFLTPKHTELALSSLHRPAPLSRYSNTTYYVHLVYAPPLRHTVRSCPSSRPVIIGVRMRSRDANAASPPTGQSALRAAFSSLDPANAG